MAAAANPRMLERRISNNRLDLNNDQQMNYLLAWFNVWSDLQKEDFVPILGNLMNSKHINGITEDMKAMNCGSSSRLGPSLFDCQIGLFKNWFLSWSDDKKNYLVRRLQELDVEYFKKYEDYLVHGKESPEKDYFEPGIPPELDLSIDRSSTASDFNDLVVEGVDDPKKSVIHDDDEQAAQDDREDENEEGGDSNDDEDEELCKENEMLSSIVEEI